MKSKAAVFEYADSIGCEVDRNSNSLKELKKTVMGYLDSKKDEYERNGFIKTQINLINYKEIIPSFEAIFLSKDNVFYAADKISRSIMEIKYKTDGYF